MGAGGKSLNQGDAVPVKGNQPFIPHFLKRPGQGGALDAKLGGQRLFAGWQQDVAATLLFLLSLEEVEEPCADGQVGEVGELVLQKPRVVGHIGQIARQENAALRINYLLDFPGCTTFGLLLKSKVL